MSANTRTEQKHYADRRAFECSMTYPSRYFAVIHERRGVNRFPCVEEVRDKTGVPIPDHDIITIYRNGAEVKP